LGEALSFTEELTSWVKTNCPASLRGSRFSYDGGSQQAIEDPDFLTWFDACLERGFTAPDWPEEYGGAGLSREQTKSFYQVFRQLRVPNPVSGTGKEMFGPLLLELGTQDQKRRHLSPIVRGEVRWCQGYSEPGAGSDLASLQTRAVDHGDYYLINGSKIWTSNAYMSDWMFCLVRTDPQANKHEGISFVLLDMDDPGLTVNRIELINGDREFCQVFFDNVKAQKNDLVGNENAGWTIAKRLLQFERSAVGEGSFIPRSEPLPELLTRYAPHDAARRERVLRLEIHRAAYRLTQLRAAEEQKLPGAPTFATSTFKYLSTQLESMSLDETVSLMGIRGLGWEGEGEGFAADELATTRKMLLSKGFLIAGGSSEVQLNVIAKRVLGLPD
jgi:acyl-CoA dehydrogenase